jgi:hypothetical protein
MQTEDIIEEIIATVPWYKLLLSSEDWVVLGLLATTLTFAIFAWRQRQGKPWIGWLLVLTSAPAALSFFAPLGSDDTSAFSLLLTIDTRESLTLWLWFAGPYLSAIVLLLWKLRLLVSRPVARGTVLFAVGLLVLAIVSDVYLVGFVQNDWLFNEPTPYVFGLSALASVILIISVVLHQVSAPTSVSSLLMMIFVVHSAVILSAKLDQFDPNIGVGFYVSILSVAIFAAEIGYTIVREWSTDAYWVWEADQAQ